MRRDVLTLCYHAVSETWPATLAVTPERFERQLQALLLRGYRPMTFSAAVRSPPGTRSVAVTFDDAYLSVLTVAQPVLARLGFPATVFVPTDHVATGAPMRWPGIDHWLGTPHEPELVGLRWPQLASLADRGWEIGSHTRSHPHLTETTDDDALMEELTGSRAVCERELGVPCLSIAYPYGDVDGRVTAAAAMAGYGTGAALPKGRHRVELLSWPRVGVYRGDDDRRFALKIAPGFRRLQMSPAWSALAAARSFVRRRNAR